MEETSRTERGERPPKPLDESRLAWIIDHVLPHEREVRQWLRRFTLVDPDDVIQECYARLCAGPEREILNGRALFFRCAHNLVIEEARKANVRYVGQALAFDDGHEPMTQLTPERHAASRQEMARIRGRVLSLPKEYRDAFLLRKIYCMTYNQIAKKLGITRRTVERRVLRGLKLISDDLEITTMSVSSEEMAGDDTFDHVRKPEKIKK
ncbi:sigma-70 family RNA polymerase sigma factor [Gluconacetobacter tumulicola]|uniref:RNA polymerase sigma factor n=1 Tax=Gluconacetobacter tumulicola TaxID=1017177 RepID=A0A7W4P776_9PROT|nr:RNA polymerase sigma factor [Gluconacetobacter tumulicola]